MFHSAHDAIILLSAAAAAAAATAMRCWRCGSVMKTPMIEKPPVIARD